MHQGKVGYIGASTIPASQIVEAQLVALDRHLRQFVTEQLPYSIRGPPLAAGPTIRASSMARAGRGRQGRTLSI